MALPVSAIAVILIAGTTVAGSAAVISMRHPSDQTDSKQVQQLDQTEQSELRPNIKVIPPTTAPVPNNSENPLPTVPGTETAPPNFGKGGRDDDDDYKDDSRSDDDSDKGSWTRNHQGDQDDDSQSENESDDD